MTTDIFTTLRTTFDIKSVKGLFQPVEQKQEQQINDMEQQQEPSNEQIKEAGSSDVNVANEAVQEESAETLNASNGEGPNLIANEDAEIVSEQSTPQNNDDTTTPVVENDASVNESSSDSNILSNSFNFIGDKYERLKSLLALPENSNASTENDNSKQCSCENVDECSCGKSLDKTDNNNNNNTDELPPPLSAPTSRRTSSTENPYINRNRRHSSYVSPDNDTAQEELRKMRREALLENAQKKTQLLKEYKAKTRR